MYGKNIWYGRRYELNGRMIPTKLEGIFGRMVIMGSDRFPTKLGIGSSSLKSLYAKKQYDEDLGRIFRSI